jgi:hypothetical protein
MLHRNRKPKIMNPIDIPAIEEQARELRAAEIMRVNGLFAERAALMTKLAADTAIAGSLVASEMLRPLFSWNPQTSAPVLSGNLEPVLERMNKAAFRLFSWNPQDRRS